LALYAASQTGAGNDKTTASFGSTTLAAFERLKQGISPLASGVAGRIPGNGPVLKMAPVGLYMQATGQYEEGLRFAERAGKMTHLDPRSVASGIVQAHAIFALLRTYSETCREQKRSQC
jgi:ADP-ribosylglycohydrolase